MATKSVSSTYNGICIQTDAGTYLLDKYASYLKSESTIESEITAQTGLTLDTNWNFYGRVALSSAVGPTWKEPTPPTTEFRGGWVKSYAQGAVTTVAARQGIRDQTISILGTGNFNAIFIDIDNSIWGDPTSLREHELNLIAFLGDLVTAGLNSVLDCHAWVSCRDRQGTTRAFTDAGEPQAQADWINDTVLADYDSTYGINFAGVHLDHIRYDQDEADGFYGYPRIDATKTAGVTNTVQTVRTDLNTKYPGLLLSNSSTNISSNGHLSGGPYDGAYWPLNTPYMYQYQQATIDWVENGDLDFACRMNYTPNDTYWIYEWDQWQANCPININNVYMALGWTTTLPGIENPPHDQTIGKLIDKIFAARRDGCKGFAIFPINDQFEVEDNDLAAALAASCWKTYKAAP